MFVWVCAPGKERSINHILYSSSYSWFWAALWVLEPTQPLKKQQVLTTKPPLHLLWHTPFILSTWRGVQEDQKFKIIVSCTCIWSQSGLQVRHSFKKKKNAFCLGCACVHLCISERLRFGWGLVVWFWNRGSLCSPAALGFSVSTGTKTACSPIK